jgi:site-specific recombinase XerD
LDSGAHQGRTLKKQTVAQYVNMQRSINQYLESSQQQNITVQSLDRKFYDGYVAYLNGKGLKLNTVGTFIKNLKAALNWLPASERINCEFMAPRKCKKLAEEVDNVYLSTSELRAIETVELKETELDHVRDQFLLLAWTGCRYSDLGKLDDTKALQRGYFEIEQYKTGARVCIPVFEQVRRIFAKYHGQLPNVVSNQMFNTRLKEVCRLAGITEETSITHTIAGERTKEVYPKFQLVSAHTARRSFATNMFEHGVPAMVIRQITGHKTERAFLSYIKTDPEKYAAMLIEQWNRRQKELRETE